MNKKIIILLAILPLLLSSVSAAQIVQKIPIMQMATFHNQTGTYNPTDGSTGIVEIDLSKYSGVTDVFVEYTAKKVLYGSPNANNGWIRLYDKTHSTEVDGSVVVAGWITTGYTVFRSQSIKNYIDLNGIINVYPQIKASGFEIYLSQTAVIILQTIEDPTDMNTRTYISIGDDFFTNSRTFIEVGCPKRWDYNYLDYDALASVYFEATSKRVTTGIPPSTTVALYDEGGAVTGGSFQSGTSYARQRTIDIKAYMTSGEYQTTRTRGENLAFPFPAQTTTYLKNASLVIDQSGDINKIMTTIMTFSSITSSSSGVGFYDTVNYGMQYDSDEWADVDLNFFGSHVQKISAGEEAYGNQKDDTVDIDDSNTTITPSAYTLANSISFQMPSGDSYVTTGIMKSGGIISTTLGRLVIVIEKMRSPSVEEDTCTPPVSGDWVVADECYYSTDQVAPANIYIGSTGVIGLDNATLYFIGFISCEPAASPRWCVKLSNNAKVRGAKN